MLYVGSLTDGLPLPLAKKAVYVDVMPELSYWTDEEWSKEVFLDSLIKGDKLSLSNNYYTATLNFETEKEID